jgi:hypothetical protein
MEQNEYNYGLTYQFQSLQLFVTSDFVSVYEAFHILSIVP